VYNCSAKRAFKNCGSKYAGAGRKVSNEHQHIRREP